MDEGSLEAAIETYNAQLQQVDTALGAGLDPSQHSDLLKLKEDLHQLIELTESSLVSVKKSRLLASLEEGLTSPAEPSGEATQASLDDEFAAFYASVGGPSCGEPCASDNTAFSQGSSPSPAQASEEEEDEEGQEEIDDEMSGMKVCAPYRTSWGTLEYHNAMVVGAEASDCVRVLYVHPTHKSMKPCPYFLEDKCRFVDRCRFSHGEVVSVSELRQFEDSDLSSFQEGSACLARHEDGIWYPATITDIDSGYYTVKFNSALLKEAVVEADGIIPPLRKEHPSSSESEDDDMVEYSAYAKVVDSMSTESEDWAAPCSSSFGGWEQHTRGIGSKLMAKMGYEFGKGLGRNAEGRVEPVLAVVLPKGKSLDQCADILQKKRLGKLGKDRPGNSRKKGKWRSGPSKTRTDVFDFLNSQLGGERQGDSAEAGAPAETNSKETYRGGKTAKRSLNVKLYQASGKVAQTEREINSITKSLSRNMGRDKAMTSHLEERLSAARKQLVVLKEQEVSIQRERRKADTHKKMTEF